MKLTVKNFGPIREAKNIEVSPMTVFVGPSNTGKSYLAVLIYSIMNMIGDRRPFRLLNHTIEQKVNRKKLTTLETYKDEEKMLSKIEEIFIEWAEIFSEFWTRQVVYCFGSEGKSMLETKNIAIKISASENGLILNLTSPKNSRLTSQHKKNIIKQLLEDNNFSSIYEQDQLYRKRLGARSLADRLESYLLRVVIHHFNSMLFPQHEEVSDTEIDTHYLPAIRGGIMQSHRTLVGALIDRAPMAGLDAISPIPLFSGVLSDFMKKLINVEGVTRDSMRRGAHTKSVGKGNRSSIRKIGREMEEEIMEGTIYAEISEARYPDFRYITDSGGHIYDLPLMSVSSMVSELAPVSLFIRRYVNRDDLFILEEPEAHLHPAAQRKICNTLVQLVNADVRVLITTHSDYILEQISNYVHAFSVDKKINKQALDKEKISVYLFDRPRGSKDKKTVVKLISFRPDVGILTKDHLKVSSNLYNQTVGLLNAVNNND